LAIQGVAQNCAQSHLYLWGVKKEVNHLIAAHEQRMTHGSEMLFKHYYVNARFKDAARVYVENTTIQRLDIIHMHSILAQDDRPLVQYFFGGVVRPYKYERVERAIAYYQHCYGKAQSATLCWMFIATKRIGFYKDIARIIGKIVFASRETPTLWQQDQKYNSRENKKLKK
jgi:hypothetical protein